jgi:hypothetical protein
MPGVGVMLGCCRLACVGVAVLQGVSMLQGCCRLACMGADEKWGTETNLFLSQQASTTTMRTWHDADTLSLTGC